MTKEEKQAERYVNGIPIFADEGEGFSRTQMKQAYLAGLKVGRPKWHKVADGDLPKDSRTVLDERGNRFYYFRGHFYYESESIFDWQPIAWCEIPKYTEK